MTRRKSKSAVIFRKLEAGKKEVGVKTKRGDVRFVNLLSGREKKACREERIREGKGG